MEEKKFNNAIEKSENLSADAKGVRTSGRTRDNKRNALNMQAPKNAEGNSMQVEAGEQESKKKLPPREKPHEEVLAMCQELEEAKAEQRIQKAEQREREKQAKKRAKLAKQQAADRKSENVKQLKIKKREERLARRDQLKHEREQKKQEAIQARKQRRENLRAERQARLDGAKSERARIRAIQRSEKHENRVRLRQERQEARREKRAQRADERRQKRESRTSRGLGGWLVAVIVLGCSTLILTTMLIFNNYMSGGGAKMLAGSYSKAFYDLVGYIDNIDVNLSKIAVTNDEQSSQRMLADLMVQSNLAAEDLEALPLHDESRHSTVKFINQLGDFSKYLNNKLISGEQLTDDDRENLEEFKRINCILKRELNELAKEMGNNYDFSTMLSGQEDNIVFERFNKLESNAVEYPKMIYDGPFADNPHELNPRRKTGEKIDEERVVAIVQNFFETYDLTDVKLSGKTEGESFDVYNVEADLNGEQLFAQVSEFGELVTFDCYCECEAESISRDQAIEFGYEFLQKCGYKSIKAVWTTQSEGICYINFAGQKDQIILYSDLIKVSVCLGDGRIYAMDAKSYIENHQEREIPQVQLRVEQAEQKLSKKMQVLTSRLALIPLETGKEKLAYEFFCETAEGEEYYVYIDAVSGSQIEMFKVVFTDEGTLLL